MSAPYGVIIAGGQGQRLGGVRKGELKIGGRRLIDRVAASLSELTAPLLVATGHGTLALPPGAVGVPDLDHTLGGPLAGLAAAVNWLAEQGIGAGLLVSSPVDAPFLPPDFTAVMTQALGPHAAVYARWGDQLYPPHALWQLAAIATLPHRVRAGTAPHSLKALLAELGAKAHDWHGASPFDPFENLNTLADLVRLGRRAKTLGGDFPQERVQ